MSAYWKRFSVLGFLGILVSGYLLVHFTAVTRGFQVEKSFCSISESLDCDAVSQSSWSSFLGIPVAGWGLTFYLVLVALVFARSKYPESDTKEQTRTGDILIALSFLSLPPALALLYASHFIIGKYCLMCLLLDLANLLLFIVALKSPARTPGFAPALGNGLKGLVQDAFSFFPSHAENKKAPHTPFQPLGYYFWSAAFLGLLISVVSPDLLSVYYFQPSRETNFDKLVLEPVVREWRAAKIEEVPINREGDAYEKDFTIGSPEAPVTIVTFSDFECPYCKSTAQYLKPFLLKYPNDFFFVFKNYPLDQDCNAAIKHPKHQFACQAAYYARCAGVQSDESFWKMHDRLVDLPLISEESFPVLPGSIGLSSESFAACLKDERIKQRVIQDTTVGNEIKVVSTPTVLINKKRVQVLPAQVQGLLLQILAEVKGKK